ncbi:MAG: HTTM domain-containing protein [Myxococcales bacterium]|nr:HTTM domain-containing protein [Myxococcales bacterium]
MPLAILGFMSSRIVHADHWIGDAGFIVPDLGGDWRQPVHLAPLAPWQAWLLVSALVTSGVAFALGAFTRAAGAVFAITLAYVALADRLAAFTVSKLAPVLVLALVATPCAARTSVDAWWAARRGRAAGAPTHVSWGNVRFFQALLVVFYLGAGVCKLRGDWLDRYDVLWTHLHDSYQTPVTVLVANLAPTWSWGGLQVATLVFETGAPLLLAAPWTRGPALAYGLAMHAMIGLMFGPVVWFSLLMMIWLAASFAPPRWLEVALRWPAGAALTRER